jgi:PAS domain S-box-containing protein
MIRGPILAQVAGRARPFERPCAPARGLARPGTEPTRPAGWGVADLKEIHSSMPPTSSSIESGGEEQRFRLLVQSITDYAIYMLDPTGVVITWNPGAQRFKGYERDEILGQHFSRFYTDEDRASGLPARALAMAEGEGRFEQEGWRVRKDGTRMWAHVVIDPIRGRSGQLLGFAKITRDISDKKEAQERLRLSEERFRLLVKGIKDYAIYMLDPLGRVTNWNAGAEEFKGYTEAEIVGEHFSRFYTEEDREAGLPARALATAEREGRFAMEGWRVRKDGTRFWADVVIDPIRDAQGGLLGYAKITRDVTERRNAQLALQDAQARFVQSQKLEMIGQLTGGVAHDFNNLLAVVLGNLDLMRRRPGLDDRFNHLIENSIEAAKRGASLTQRMLAFARRQELKTEAVDVPDLVRGLADMLQRSIGPRIHISTHFPLVLRPALADPNQLELALLNLAVNARDAMPEGGAIAISAEELALDVADADGTAPGRYLCLRVQDDGHGMDAETLARAVEPFFTTKGVGKGTGLGLSMAHGFATQSGGRLRLRSAPGEGTTAELLLPAGSRIPRPAPAPEPRTATEQTGPMRILVVDDDNLVLANTSAMLEDLGHEVLEASSGEQALRILQRYDGLALLVTDHLMPGMTGAQLIQTVQEQWPDLPIVLATGYADLEQGAARGAQRLMKPFMQQELAAAISAAFRARQPSGDAPPFRSK